MKRRWFFTIAILALMPLLSFGQKYELFEISQDELYWRNNYHYVGNADSLRREVVQMLKSKFFTFNVIRNETGYNGEIKHYKVDVKKFGRTYFNTPRKYTEGEWTGKFVVEIFDNYYRVTIYALYAEKFQKSTGYYRTETVTKGRYIEVVTKKDRLTFKRSEFQNLDLMSLSLKDNFDIRNTVVPTN